MEHKMYNEERELQRDFQIIYLSIMAISGWVLFVLSLWRMWSVC